MKYLIFLATLFFIFTGKLFSADIDWQYLPAIEEFNSNAVYRSSTTNCAASVFNLPVSTYSVAFYGISISSYGSADSKVDIYDSKTSTNNVVKILGPINTGAINPIGSFIPFNISTTSGVAVNIQGTTPPCLNYIFRQR